MKGRLILRAALAASLLTTLVSVSLAARAVGRLYVKGAVTRAGSPIRSAWVTITQNGAVKGKSLTGDDGKYYIGELDAGQYEIVVAQGPRTVFTGRVKLPEETIYNIKVAR